MNLDVQNPPHIYKYVDTHAHTHTHAYTYTYLHIHTHIYIYNINNDNKSDLISFLYVTNISRPQGNVIYVV